MHRIWISLTAALLAFAPAASLANHHEPGEHAEDHRSDKADERSNAQWSDEAEKGQQRSDEVRRDRAGMPNEGAKAKSQVPPKPKREVPPTPEGEQR